MGGGKICTDDIAKKTPVPSLPQQGFTQSEEGILILSGNHHLQSTHKPYLFNQSTTNAYTCEH